MLFTYEHIDWDLFRTESSDDAAGREGAAKSE